MGSTCQRRGSRDERRRWRVGQRFRALTRAERCVGVGRGVWLVVAGGAADKRARRVSRGARHGLVDPDVGRGAVRRGERSRR